MIAPPYSREFTHSVARLQNMRRIKDAATSDPETVSLNSNFESFLPRSHCNLG